MTAPPGGAILEAAFDTAEPDAAYIMFSADDLVQIDDISMKTGNVAKMEKMLGGHAPCRDEPGGRPRARIIRHGRRPG